MCGCILTLARCAEKGIPLYLYTEKSLQVLRTRIFVSYFNDNEGFQWDSKKYLFIIIFYEILLFIFTCLILGIKNHHVWDRSFNAVFLIDNK